MMCAGWLHGTFFKNYQSFKKSALPHWILELRFLMINRDILFNVLILALLFGHFNTVFNSHTGHAFFSTKVVLVIFLGSRSRLILFSTFSDCLEILPIAYYYRSMTKSWEILSNENTRRELREVMQFFTDAQISCAAAVRSYWASRWRTAEKNRTQIPISRDGQTRWATQDG